MKIRCIFRDLNNGDEDCVYMTGDRCDDLTTCPGNSDSWCRAKIEGTFSNSALSGGLARFYFDRYNPLGNAQMAEGANVVAADEREALVKAREMFGLEWIFKLRKREAC